MRKLFFITFLLAFCCNSVIAADSPEQLKKRFIEAAEANDVDALVSLYATDAAYFPVDDMVGVGAQYIRDSWQVFFSDFRITHAELTDTHLEVFGDTAASWGLWNLTVVPVQGGEATQMQGRFTDVMRNIDGTWMYIADHASVPMPPPPEEPADPGP